MASSGEDTCDDSDAPPAAAPVAASAHLLGFSDEILLHILSHVPSTDLVLNVRRTCRKLAALCLDKSLTHTVLLQKDYEQPCPGGASFLLDPEGTLEQPYFSANAQFFQALSQCSALQRLCLVSRSGTLQPEAVLAFMARCLRVVVCHLFTGESLGTCRSLQQALLRR
ncbi:hypothetical protein Celaphus_00007341 [Cervus elaphus hippelaphus]|uniref:Uncharacterized protein n=1 Tax=Cervus elaphus hippelaphus TaxID=46360 RepID=A0A212CYN6_CEREH|nr:hypothetical protein Celaphus_00007341 [Cervus elaphus hippelaphus]